MAAVKVPGASSLATARHISVTSFRRDGRGVHTPVEFVEKNGSVYFRTLPDSGKVKRIRHNSRVVVAPCTMRGRLTGFQASGKARLLTPEEFDALLPLFYAKYGLVWRLISKVRRPRSQAICVDFD